MEWEQAAKLDLLAALKNQLIVTESRPGPGLGKTPHFSPVAATQS